MLHTHTQELHTRLRDNATLITASKTTLHAISNWNISNSLFYRIGCRTDYRNCISFL